MRERMFWQGEISTRNTDWLRYILYTTQTFLTTKERKNISGKKKIKNNNIN